MASQMYETICTEDDSEWASDHSASEHAYEQALRAREAGPLRRMAEEESQWQCGLFAKAPRQSYVNRAQAKFSLLSRLLNPDPNVFPPHRPYHRNLSSQGVVQLCWQNRRPSSPLPMAKGAVAPPQTVAVLAQAPCTDGMHASSVKAKDPMLVKKGLAQITELEDDDGEGEDTGNSIQVSRSLAQRKLAALADSDRQRRLGRGPALHEPPALPQISSIATAPVPLCYPYNLPAPAPPMTPRTTRRHMLSTELSESLRRNLLWERQVSRKNAIGPRRNGLIGNGPQAFPASQSARDPDVSGCIGGIKNQYKHEARAARLPGWTDDYHFVGW